MGKSLKILELTVGIIFLVIFALVIKQHYLSSSDFNFGTTLKMEGQTFKYKVEGFFNGVNRNKENHPDEVATSIPVLVYHGILKKESGEDVSTQEFKEEMFALKRAGYETITIEDYYAFINNTKKIYGKPFLLTFDDGRKDSFYPADPILKALNYNAVMYVITGHYIDNKGSSYYLDKTELMKMVNSGRWSLQSHGRYDHNLITIDASDKKGRFMTNLQFLVSENRYETVNEYFARIQKDLIDSKNDIEKDFGIKVISYAYPFGDYGTTEEEMANILNITRNVYPIAFSQFRPEARSGYYRYNYSDGNDSFFQRRIKVLPSYTSENLIDILSAGINKTLPYEEKFDNKYNWIYGSDLKGFEMSSDRITLKTVQSGSTALMMLDGSHDLKNYEFSFDLDLAKGESIELIARGVTGNNYLSCEFAQNQVLVKQVIDKETETLADTKKRFAIDITKHLVIGLWVKNDRVGCTVNGVTVAFAGNTNNKLDHGSVGLKIWDPETGTAKIYINKFVINKSE